MNKKATKPSVIHEKEAFANHSFASLQNLLDSSVDVICAIDAEGKFRFVSKASLQVWGYTPEELYGKPCLDLVVPEDQLKTNQLAIQIMKGKNVTTFENRYRRKDNSIVPMTWSASWNHADQLMYCVARDASERVEAAKDERERLTRIFDSIQDCFFSVDRNWIITIWNKRVEEVLSKKKEEVLGKNIWDVFQEAVDLKYYTEYHRAVSENCAVHFEEFLPSMNQWFSVSAYPSADGLSVYFQEITDRKKKEEQLHIANERFEIASLATSDAVWDFDLLTNEVYFNQNFEKLFGYQQNNANVYTIWADHLYPHDKEAVVKSLEKAIHDDHASYWEAEYRFVRKDGSIAYVLDRGTIIRDGKGRAVRMVGSMQDITKRVKDAEELKTLSLVAKETVNAVVITDVHERITWVNKAFCDITEYSFDEVIGKRPAELLQGPNTSKTTKSYLRKCIKHRLPFNCEIINYSKSGREYWMDIKGQPVFDEKGELKQFIAIQMDVTARKESESIISLSEMKYKLLFYSSPMPKWIFDADTFQILDVNDAALELYRYKREEFLKLKITDLKVSDEEGDFYRTVNYLKDHPHSHFNNIVRHRKKDGQVFYIDVTSFLLQLPSGLHFISTGADMTEKLELQQKLIAEKVASQKEKSRAIISAQEQERNIIGKELHDNVNQLLTTAKLYIENIKYYPDHKDLYVDKGVNLMLRCINEIRLLSRQLVTPVMSDVGFEATIHELVDHYQSLHLFEVNLQYHLCEDTIDKDLKLTIYRILQEQFNNTVKHANASMVHVSLTSTTHILHMVYEDNGIGFNVINHKKGIGLKNIQNRAEAFKGQVTIESGEGKGTRMEIQFPLTEKAVAFEL